MIDLKDAIEKGREFLVEVYKQPNNDNDGVILDSAKPENKYWLIKYRVPLSVKPINSLQNVLGISKRIYYKTVKIDKKGNVLEIIDEQLPKFVDSEIQT
jgi:hypothetical protein